MNRPLVRKGAAIAIFAHRTRASTRRCGCADATWNPPAAAGRAGISAPGYSPIPPRSHELISSPCGVPVRDTTTELIEHTLRPRHGRAVDADVPSPYYSDPGSFIYAAAETSWLPKPVLARPNSSREHSIRLYVQKCRTCISKCTLILRIVPGPGH